MEFFFKSASSFRVSFERFQIFGPFITDFSLEERGEVPKVHPLNVFSVVQKLCVYHIH